MIEVASQFGNKNEVFNILLFVLNFLVSLKKGNNTVCMFMIAIIMFISE